MDNLIIVTGLPRSGTSMMMNMLEAGGVAVITDKQRQADEDNPYGYFELERVKEIKRDRSWLDSSSGKAVKMVSMILYDLPLDRDYFLIFMKRNLEMFEEMKRLFSKHLSEIEAWLSERKNFKTLYINYEDVLKQPLEAAENIQKFMGRELNLGNMIKSVDPTLYRQRSTGLSVDIQAKDAGLSENDNEKIKEQLSSLGYM